MDEKDKNNELMSVKRSAETHSNTDLVLEKTIFSDVFEKDIRKAYLYKKTERIGKALYLLLPAFRDLKALKDRTERIAVALLDASLLPPTEARETISRELLALSSIISMARASGKLSQMNADIVLRETRYLLAELASYEERNVQLPEAPTLAALSRTASRTGVYERKEEAVKDKVATVPSVKSVLKNSNGHKVTEAKKSDRAESILSILSSRGTVYIKDLSTMISDVSEKTIQRELQKLVLEGRVKREGERRWTRYTLTRGTPEASS